ncbi:MAG: UDP-2,3-diacylglucosamine diphosphatase [Chlorobiaceae bacterium]|nr:UDP-2,3-diacylglucosamine diphosphatase [Chlorobiaceae bacterium]NTW09987.1 UDP-2,3-diacylglucosamine diphosphatase [Chlorobiaceae bacterium]
MASTFFISDIHVGLQDKETEQLKLDNLERLFAIVSAEGRSLYMLGDILDYWLEFRHVIPKGFTRLFCLLSSLVKSGIEVVYIAGNHDFSLGCFFQEELGVRTLYGVQDVLIDGSRFVLAHGDGLGSGDLGYKLFTRVIRTPFNISMLSRFHPDFAVWLIKGYSRFSRENKPDNRVFETDRLLDFAEKLATERDFNYFICGHNHVCGITKLKTDGKTYMNLGSWIDGHLSYGVYDNGALELREL